jgi:hypothetical protein
MYQDATAWASAECGADGRGFDKWSRMARSGPRIRMGGILRIRGETSAGVRRGSRCCVRATKRRGPHASDEPTSRCKQINIRVSREFRGGPFFFPGSPVSASAATRCRGRIPPCTDPRVFVAVAPRPGATSPDPCRDQVLRAFSSCGAVAWKGWQAQPLAMGGPPGVGPRFEPRWGVERSLRVRAGEAKGSRRRSAGQPPAARDAPGRCRGDDGWTGRSLGNTERRSNGIVRGDKEG